MKTMQRLFAIILVLAVILSLVACVSSTENHSAQDESLSVQNVSNEDATDKTTGDKSSTVTETEEAVTSSAELSSAVGSETKKDNASDDESINQAQQNNHIATESKDNNVDSNESVDQTVGGSETTKDNPSDDESNNQTQQNNDTDTGSQDNPADSDENDGQTVVDSTTAPNGEFNKGIVLVKVKESFDKNDLGTLAYTSAEPMYTGSKWYIVKLNDGSKTEEAVTYLTGLGSFADVDYDYVMSTGTTTESFDVSGNPDYDQQTNHLTHKVLEGWEYATNHDKNPGGSSDVIVAVIDTGVDYKHMDLRDNIWTNSAEIPSNGIDDDGNGYVDDVYGWDCVGNDKDPMDDNGHGTHVAGIIAAENNAIGGVGVAYNCKVMVLKAGNSSGYFNSSDIAEAVQYAYMNGASVINMSFGGSSISIPVEESLENAYTSCVLVAAAGNDSACNYLGCKECDSVAVSYPAALPYVIGVMSVDATGLGVSSFSNYDHKPYDSVEYEVYAVGEAIPSCWPGNKYASLNGTSMAAPTVSGIAALLRSFYSDREVYSAKFIQSQIVNTGTIHPYNLMTEGTDGAHSVANVYEALTRLPKPEVNLYDYSIDDSVSISAANNGNGVMEAGETVRLHISLHNRGGVASNVNVSIDTNRDDGLADPYFTLVHAEMTLSDIGTYSILESGDQYFEIVVSSDCPNDYLVDFNIRYTYTNGMDSTDTTAYTGESKARFNVSRGYHLPSVISEDTVFSADKLYIVGNNVTIPAGVTVTFAEGCEIQFFADQDYFNSPAITVYGTLNFQGTKDNMITIHPSERYSEFACLIYVKDGGSLTANYIDAMNFTAVDTSNQAVSVVSNSNLRSTDIVYCYEGGRCKEYGTALKIDTCYDSYVELTKWNTHSYVFGEMNRCYVRIYSSNSTEVNISSSFTNNILCSEYKDKGTFFASPFIFGNSSSCTVENNIFMTADDDDILSLSSLTFRSNCTVANNTFSAAYQKYADQVIQDYFDANGNPTVDVYGSCSDLSALYPHVVSVQILNADEEPVTTVGTETIMVRVTFNRPMDMTQNTYLTFGTIAPYGDYRIDGAYVSDTVWEGVYTLKAQTENGQNFLQVHNACQADDPTKKVLGEYQLHEFTLDTTAAMAMTLQATATEQGIELTWAQDDYATLMGYNIYRADSKDGNYVKINPSVLLPTDASFLDDNAEPGKTYWYTFTVVLSDFSESAPAGKVFCTAADTLVPTVYHTPVNQGYAGNNLVISCTASDNMQIASVTLSYRTVGCEAWKSLPMSKVNDKYSATVFGSELSMDGLEYYITASDGTNTVSKGTADTPYQVVIKDASAISRIGDVDGSGSVTTKDALMLMQCLNGDLLLEDDAFKRADLNGDGQLASMEALRILQYVNGKVATLEM